jgi:hypothetical protein
VIHSGDTLNNNVLVDINLQLCTRIRLPIAQSLPLGDRTAEMNFILNLIPRHIVDKISVVFLIEPHYGFILGLSIVIKRRLII